MSQRTGCRVGAGDADADAPPTRTVAISTIAIALPCGICAASLLYANRHLSPAFLAPASRTSLERGTPDRGMTARFRTFKRMRPARRIPCVSGRHELRGGNLFAP